MPSDNNYTQWKELTAGRKRVAAAVAFLIGTSEFDRIELEEAAKESYNVSVYTDNEEKLYTSLNYTYILNSLTEDGYLKKTHQGGQELLLVDYGSEEPTAVPAGDISQLRELARTALERNGIGLSILEEIDFTDLRDIKRTINNAVGDGIFSITGDRSIYRMPQDAHNRVISQRAENIPLNLISSILFYEYPSIGESTPNYRLEATVEETGGSTPRLRVYEDGSPVDEIAETRTTNETLSESPINETFDVIQRPEQTVLLVPNPDRTEAVKQSVDETIDRFEEALLEPEEWGDGYE